MASDTMLRSASLWFSKGIGRDFREPVSSVLASSSEPCSPKLLVDRAAEVRTNVAETEVISRTRSVKRGVQGLTACQTVGDDEGASGTGISRRGRKERKHSQFRRRAPKFGDWCLHSESPAFIQELPYPLLSITLLTTIQLGKG